MTVDASASTSPATRLVNEDYPAPEAGTFDKQKHHRTAAVRLRAGLVNTKAAHADYKKNCDDSLKANEVFIIHGSDQSKFRKISEAMPASRKGKQIDFFTLRDHMPKVHPLMP